MNDQQPSLKLNKEAEFYNNILYTVVPKGMSLEYGVYPDDQKFHSKFVILWDTYQDLSTFNATIWKKLKVEIPKEVKYNRDLNFTRLLGGTYGVSYIPNSWKMEEQKMPSLYNE